MYKEKMQPGEDGRELASVLDGIVNLALIFSRGAAEQYTRQS
jgi:hypothetical protein